ncbi:hypothetical protein M514_13001 [Trichuris suis]|uniref:Uncharacterized protein n=1 Tax=Trichuris suis TaxID=68888 RepID=A0A085MSD2_9BILA|nr:hypothetical protein M513_13001 [Trichuris suis]KFD60128.1 hypothetical protein M514_13001 [Trichuris suis]
MAYCRSLLGISNRRTFPGVMASESKLDRDALFTMCGTTLMIAKTDKPHNIEDLILPAAADILEMELHQPARTIVGKKSPRRLTVK